MLYPNQLGIGNTSQDIKAMFGGHEIVIDPARLSDEPKFTEHTQQELKKHDNSYSQIAHVQDVPARGRPGDLTFWIDTNGVIVSWSWSSDALVSVSQAEVNQFIQELDKQFGDHAIDDVDDEMLIWNSPNIKRYLNATSDGQPGGFMIVYGEQKIKTES